MSPQSAAAIRSNMLKAIHNLWQLHSARSSESYLSNLVLFSLGVRPARFHPKMAAVRSIGDIASASSSTSLNIAVLCSKSLKTRGPLEGKSSGDSRLQESLPAALQTSALTNATNATSLPVPLHQNQRLARSQASEQTVWARNTHSPLREPH